MSTLSTADNPFLDQDPSRLPCGTLEHFVYAVDRRAVLNPRKHDEENKYGDDSDSKQANKSVFVIGDEEHTYYLMLQIQNEIEANQESKSDPTDKLKQLNDEMAKLIQAEEKKKKDAEKDNRYYRTPQRLQTMKLRHFVRNFNVLNKKEKEWFYKYVKDTYSPRTRHNKPHDPSRTTYAVANVVIKKSNPSAITEKELSGKVMTQLTEWIDKKTNEYGYYSPNRYFTHRALPWLLQQKMEKKGYHNLLTSFDKLMLLDTATIVDMIAADLKEKDNYRNFGDLAIHRKLTLKQLDKLKSSWGVDIANTTPFLGTYIKKLAPVSLQRYEGKKWDDIPLEVRETYLNTLYEYGIKSVTSTNSGQYTCRAYICFHYMHFMEQTHGIYDIEAIIEYLSIPKYARYIPEDSGFFKLLKSAVTSNPQANFGASFAFLSCYRGLPTWNKSADFAFIKRFLLRVLQYPQLWAQFISLKSSAVRSSKASGNRKKNIMAVMKQWIGEEWLQRFEAEAMLYGGDTSKTNDCIKLLSDSDGKQYVNQIKESVVVEFDKSNPNECRLTDDINITVHVKNVSQVLVKIFEINTRSYFRDKQRELETDLNLDGLNASEEWTIDAAELDLKSTFHKKEIQIAWPAALQQKRGIYFVDLIANGQHARAVVKVGTIKFFHRITEAGHVFQLLDEESGIIEDGSIWMAGHAYHSKNDANNEIFIPFSNVPRVGQKIILQRNDDRDFNVLASFDHKSENYAFQCGLYIDREQLLEKKRAKIIVRSALFLNGNRVSVGLIENCKLSINIQTSCGVDVDKTFNDFELFDDRESTEEFTVPNECFTVRLSLSGTVNNITNKSKVSVDKSQSFTINQIDKSRDISQFHLIPCKHSKYVILLSGKNGEGLSGLDCAVTLYHRWISKSQSLQTLHLTTNAEGRIYLPALDKNFYKIDVVCAALKGLGNEWLLESGLFHCDTPNVIQMAAGDSVKIPFIPSEQEEKSSVDYRYKRKHRGPIMMLYDKYLSHKYVDNLNYDNGYITIKGLETGSYILRFLDDDMDDIEISVSAGEVLAKGFIANKNEIVELSPKEILQIQSIAGDRNKGVEIAIGGVSAATRIHLIATHFLPRFSVSKFLDVLDPSNLKLDFMANAKNMYLPQRIIGEEYRYVLERQTAPKFIGNSLQRPSLLIKPLEHQSTETKKQDAKKGDEVERHKMADVSAQDFGGTMRKNVREDKISLAPNQDRATLEFVGDTALILCNLQPDEKGMVRIDGKVLDDNGGGLNHNLLRVIAMDEQHVAIKSFVLENAAEREVADIAASVDEKEEKQRAQLQSVTGPVFGYRDTRLFPGLDVNKSFTEQREIAILYAENEEFAIADYLTSTVETYQTVNDLFNLLQTISGNTELKEKWSFLHGWDRYNDEEKMEKYEDYMCHELNLFIYFKDRPFFENIVRNLVSCKLYKDVIDLYLLNDVEALADDYCALNEFNALNALEKILIASIVPAMKEKTLRYFRDKNETLTVDPQRMDKLFQTALASKALQDDKSMLDMQREEKCAADSDEEEEEELYSDSDDEEECEQENATITGKMQTKGAPSRPYERQRAEMRGQNLYKQVEKTKEYQETYYYNTLYEKNTKFVVDNESKFWCGFGEYFLSDKCEEKAAFLSDYVLLPTGCINEILLALAVIGLPFKSEGPQFIYPKNAAQPDEKRDINDENRNALILRASSPTIVFAKQLKESQKTNMSQVSIHMHYYDESDQFATDGNGERVDKFVSEFVPGKVYAGRAILTNVSSMEQHIEILSQIPTGAVPVDNGFKTRTTFMRLRPYSTNQYRFFFYFPDVGRFQQFPVTVSKKGKILGQSSIAIGSDLVVAVPDIAKAVDVRSWKDVSLKGSDVEVVRYLEQNNVFATDLSRIYWRIRENGTFFVALCKVLESQLKYDANVWGYCCEFLEDAALRKYLSMRPQFVAKLAPFFNGEKWLGLYDDALFGRYSHLEYIPLVNSRAHLLGQKRQILNDKLKKQYASFLKRVSYKSSSLNDIASDDKLSAIYYLLLQDRISEALYLEKTLDVADCLENYELTFDYLTAYMALYNDSDDEKAVENSVEMAREIAAKYAKRELPDSKKKLFEDIEVLLDDLGDFGREEDFYSAHEKKVETHDLGDRDRKMEKLAQISPSLQFEIKDRKVVISSQLVKKCTVNFYTMNTEVLFSFSPFLSSSAANESIFCYIAPNESINIADVAAESASESESKGESAWMAVEIPKSLQNANLFIQVVSDTVTESAPYYDHQLSVQLTENFGHLRVLDRNEAGRPVKRAYVKVYAKMENGANEFYKDGYTDIRGGFDYAAVSTDQLERAQKFSILIATEKYGCLVKEAAVPKQ